jgi:hypothetical protein
MNGGTFREAGAEQVCACGRGPVVDVERCATCLTAAGSWQAETGYRVLRVHEVKRAAKPHECAKCGSPIYTGEPATLVVWCAVGEFRSEYRCRFCG